MKDDEGIDYKTLYTQAWEQYNIYFQAYTIHNNRFNTIGAVASIFILVLTTAADVWSRWLYLPLIFFLVPFFISLANLMYRNKVEMPWYGQDKLKDQIREGTNRFYEKQIEDIFKAASTLYKYKDYAKTRMKISVWSIIIGIGISFLILILPLVCSFYCENQAICWLDRLPFWHS